LKTLNVIYISRIGFGILAAVVAALVVPLDIGDPLLNGITIGLAVYLISYYLLKWRFMNKVDQPTKIITMGIGIYFLTFIMIWVLLITPSLAAPVASFAVDPLNPGVGDVVAFNAELSYDPDGEIVNYSWNFGDEGTAEGMTVNHSYNTAGDYIVTLTVRDDQGISISTAIPLEIIA
jgi:PKD repeat protein